jgi:hypothetical protein
MLVCIITNVLLLMYYTLLPQHHHTRTITINVYILLLLTITLD